MNNGILKFTPAAGQERALYQMGEAFEALAASYVNEHQGEGRKAALAHDLLRLVFQKCISCRADGRVINVAAIEYCHHDDCPLHDLGSKLAAGVMIITGDKRGPDENSH